MKVVSTDALTKLIQLVKSAFISVDDTVATSEVTLATVATTGDYDDLINTPTIPTVNNPTITIKQGGVTKGSFTLNQATGATIALDAGGGSGSGYHPDLFDVKWADHICNDVQWLRADTFSWQSGAVYQVAYQHLADDIDGKTLQSETVAGTTIQFYLADDGHKICPATEESNVSAIYNSTGVAWYYIIDTTNTRFKLPRTKFAFTGIRNGVGGFVEAGAPNITGNTGGCVGNGTPRGAFYQSTQVSTAGGGGGRFYENGFDASRSSSVYGNSDTVQPKATEMYLYFYVGNFTQTALENTAGLNAELFNNKVDKGHQVIAFQEPTAANNYTWYRKYADGWVEQGGIKTNNNGSDTTVNLPVAMANNYYTAQLTPSGSQSLGLQVWYGIIAKTTTSFTFKLDGSSGDSQYGDWQVSGMAA